MKPKGDNVEKTFELEIYTDISSDDLEALKRGETPEGCGREVRAYKTWEEQQMAAAIEMRKMGAAISFYEVRRK